MAMLTLVLAMLNAVEIQGLAVAPVEAGFGAETCGGAGGEAVPSRWRARSTGLRSTTRGFGGGLARGAMT
jgi:hypothetical protein